MVRKVVPCFQLELCIIITTTVIILLLLLFFKILITLLAIFFKKCNRSLRPGSAVAEKDKKRGETEKMISGRSEPSSELPLSSLRSPIFFFS